MLTCWVAFVSFVFYLANWVVSNYGSDVTFGQLLFHIQIGFMANEGADAAIFVSFFWQVIFRVLVTLLAFKVITRWITRVESPVVKPIFVSLVIVGTLLATVQAAYLLHVPDYIQTKLGKDLFTARYQAPQTLQMASVSQPRNLILLYVESLENDFSNIEGRNLIEPIDKIKGFKVPHFYQAPGTGWSIAGMVSSQCSIPLKGFEPSDWNTFLQAQFLPSVWCLSDELKRHGYEQIFLTGPDAAFAGVDRFYTTHQFNQVLGRDEVKKWVSKKNLFTGWGKGLHDDTLLDVAYDIAIKAAGSTKPFNLTIITTDNHSPHGMPSPRCSAKERQDSFMGAVQCSSRSVGRFIERVLKTKSLHNTDIVILGDHLFMAIPEQKSKFTDTRSIYFKYINSTKSSLGRDTMTHFDVAPSILDSLGILQDNTQRFGLGYSIFADIEDYDKHLSDVKSLEILSPSVTYDNLWQISSSPEQNPNHVKE